MPKSRKKKASQKASKGAARAKANLKADLAKEGARLRDQALQSDANASGVGQFE
jgi:hypothetical protein